MQKILKSKQKFKAKDEEECLERLHIRNNSKSDKHKILLTQQNTW